MHDSSFTLAGFSYELIIEILHFCDCATILRFGTTCKVYHELVAESTSLQLHIELEASGLELVKGSFKQDTGYSVILEDLKQFQNAWLKLDMEEPIVRSLVSSPGLWELREGFYIEAFSRSGEHFADAVQFTPLDAETPNPPPLLFGFEFRDFAADIGQAMLALLSSDRDGYACHVHICSSITGFGHPLAEYSMLTAEFDLAPPDFSSASAIEIMEHMVLVKVSFAEVDMYELLIWDWRTGSLLHRINGQEATCDFVFLDQRHLVVLPSITYPNRDGLALLVYDLYSDTPTRTTSPNGKSRVSNFSITQPILRLEFPRIKESSRICDRGAFLRSGPTPGRRVSTKSASFSCSYTMTLSMTFGLSRVGHEWDESSFYRVFIDGRSLLKHIHTSLRDGTKVLSWSMWGPNKTRWFTAPGESDQLVYWPYLMAGSKYIPPFSHLPYHCIFDFSPLIFSRSRTQITQQHPDATLIDDELAVGNQFDNLEFSDGYLPHFLAELPPRPEPYVALIGSDNPNVIDVDNNPGFDEPITSRLPYTFVCKGSQDYSHSHRGWQILGDCIVGVGPAHASSRSVTIYKLNQ